MPLDRNGGSKFVTILNVGPGVGTYIVTPAHIAIHERDNAVSFAFWRSEPNRILRVLKHRSSPQSYLWTAHFGGFERHVHLATPRRTASTVAKRVVTQIMFRRFEVTTGKNPDRSVAFNGLAFLRGLRCGRITGFLCAMVIPVSEGLRHLERLSR